MSVNYSAKPSQIKKTARTNGLVGIKVMAFQDLATVLQRMQNRALASTIRTEKQRDRLEVDPHALANALKVLDLDGRDHCSVLRLLWGQRQIDAHRRNDAARGAHH